MNYKFNDNLDVFKKVKNQGRLIAFCSSSKGTGKTWLAATLCHSLSLYKKKILFFDADCGLENISYQLDLTNSISYAKLLSGGLTLNNAVFSYKEGAFDYVSSVSGENTLALAPIGRVQILGKDLVQFSKNYDAVFLDCSDDDLKTVNIFFNLCEAIVMIVNPDKMSLTNAYKKIVHLKKINPNVCLKIVINHAQSYEEGRQVYEALLVAVEKYIQIKLELLGVIRQDPHIREAVVNKSLLLKRYPVCHGAEDAVIVAKKLLEEHFND